MEDHHNTTAAEGGGRGGEPEIKSLKDDKGQLKWPSQKSIITSKSKVDAVQTIFPCRCVGWKSNSNHGKTFKLQSVIQLWNFSFLHVQKYI